MAQTTAGASEQDSQLAAERNLTGEIGDAGGSEGQASPDADQEPGDNKERGMDGGAAEAEEHGGNSVHDEETASPAEAIDGGGGGELPDREKSPVQGCLASSTESAPEGSRVLKEEQRDAGDVNASPPSDRTKGATKTDTGTKRRMSGEMNSSDGEPLSRMDSEDR